jgi:hypothetical protein
MNDTKYCAYFTRHLPCALRDRVRIIAAQRSGAQRVSMEAIYNEALAIGIEIIEKKRRVILLD